jgi:hypothetical protein
VEEKEVIEDGQKYFEVDSCCQSQIFNVESSNEKGMNDDVL